MCNQNLNAKNPLNATNARKSTLIKSQHISQNLAQNLIQNRWRKNSRQKNSVYKIAVKILGLALLSAQIFCIQAFALGSEKTAQSKSSQTQKTPQSQQKPQTTQTTQNPQTPQNPQSQKGQEQRLIVLDPASIEIIYLLGKGESIKAIASMQHSHIYPQEHTSKLASVGSFSNPSVEKILSLKPSLVILSLYSLGLQERLENLGIKTAYLEANRLEDMYENIAKLASLLGVEQRGAELTLKTKNEIESLRKEAKFRGKSAVFLYSSNPLMAFNDNSVIADILRVLGLENKTISTNVARPILSNEFLLKANPDMLILGVQADDISALIAQNPALKNLKAYKNGAILTYPKAHRLLRVSPTIVDGIKELKSMLEQGIK